MDDADEDVYVSQLKDLFASCDTKGRGLLGQEELVELCTKLQLEGQVDLLLAHLMGDDRTKMVDFDTFKEAFVMVLSSAVDFDGMDGATDVEDQYSQGSFENSAELLDEVSPKYVKNGRRYGRRSKPEFELSQELSSFSSAEDPRSLGVELASMNEGAQFEPSEYSDARKSQGMSVAEDKSEAEGAEQIFDQEDRRSHSHSHTQSSSHRSNPVDHIRNETFEAEGQMNASMSVYEQGPNESEQVQAIWEEVGVGKDGFLDINELAVVCEHIGMDDMDRNELNNLFNKLDQDQDGRVGFEEFLDGLFRTAGLRTPAPLTPLSATPSLLNAQKAKLRMSMMSSSMDDPIYRTATPSLLFNTSTTRLFSMLDTDNTGYATRDAVVEQLEDQGIHNPHEILEALDVYADVGGKIGLADLSMALDHVLLTMGEDNGVYQAALTSYQSELRHLKSQNEQLSTERDKLKMDIAEANRQNVTLVQEIDDRHATIEKTNETKLRDMERKYQDKISSLQAQIEKEREMLSSQASSQTTKLLDEMDQLRSDETMMKERYQALTEDNDRLEQELNEAAEKLVEYQKTMTKQQRDLDGFQELEERLAELETSRDGVSKQQEEYFEQNMRDLQEKKKMLQDRVDELTQENELLKHQASERKVRRKGSKLRDRGPSRGGSVLSDYTTKPNIIKRHTNSSSENDSDLDELDPRSKRRLPKVAGIPEEEEDEESSQKKSDEEKAKMEAQMESLKQQHNEELDEVRSNYERECKDIEKKYRVEMKEMEDKFEEEISNTRELYEVESSKLARDLEEKEQRYNDEKIVMLQQFEDEKNEMLNDFEQEKNALEQAFEILKNELEESLKNEFAEELERQLAEQEARFSEERASFESALSDDKSNLVAEITQAREDGETKLRNLRTEMEVQHLEEKEDLENKFEEVRTELHRQLREKEEELDGILENGEAGLTGKLREDFDDILAQHRLEMENVFQEQLEEEKTALATLLEKERQEMQEDFDREKFDLSDAVTGEKAELLEHFQKEKADMLEKHQKERNNMEEKFKQEKQKMADKHQKEKEDMTRRNEESLEDMKRQHTKAMDKLQKEKTKLEEKLEKEKRKLEDRMMSDKQRYEEENAAIKAKYEEELEKTRQDAEVEKGMMEMAIKVEVERAVKREVTEEYEEKMDQAKQEHEDERAELIAEKELLESRLKMAEVAKQEAVVAVQMQTQEAALQQSSRPDKAAYDAVTSERDLLNLTVNGLEQKLQLVKEKAESSNKDKRTMEAKLMALQSEKSRLQAEVDDLNKKVLNMQMQVSVSESQYSREMQRVKQKLAEDFQRDVNRLREELAQRDGRLKEVERQLRERGEELTRALSINKDSEGSEVRKMRKGKEEAERKYKKMRAMLDEYMKKLREQLAKTTRHDVLLKELYVENSKLQRALQLTEERQKTAERNCHNLVEKNQAYLNILRKVCPAAV